MQALYLRRIAIRSTFDTGAGAPARLVRSDHVIALGQWPGETVPAIGRRAKSMKQYHKLAIAAFRINNAMVANLDYMAFQSGGKPFQADQHGRQICHEFPSVINVASLRRRNATSLRGDPFPPITTVSSGASLILSLGSKPLWRS